MNRLGQRLVAIAAITDQGIGLVTVVRSYDVTLQFTFLFSIYKCIHFLVAFPVAPGSPVAVEVKQSSVLLEWPYNGPQINHFQIERQFGSQEWTVFATVGALATTQVNTTRLYPFTAYEFRVLSVSKEYPGISSPSELCMPYTSCYQDVNGLIDIPMLWSHLFLYQITT